MHGVGYWVPTDDPESGNTLGYMLAHESRGPPSRHGKSSAVTPTGRRCGMSRSAAVDWLPASSRCSWRRQTSRQPNNGFAARVGSPSQTFGLGLGRRSVLTAVQRGGEVEAVPTVVSRFGREALGRSARIFLGQANDHLVARQADQDEVGLGASNERIPTSEDDECARSDCPGQPHRIGVIPAGQQTAEAEEAATGGSPSTKPARKMVHVTRQAAGRMPPGDGRRTLLWRV